MEKQPGAEAAFEAVAAVDDKENLRKEIKALVEENWKRAKLIAEMRTDCEAIWPFVRHWGLCGASTEAMEAALRIGFHAGEIGSSDGSLLRTAVEISQEAKAETIRKIADRLESSLRGKMLSKDIPAVVDGVRGLLDSL